MEENTTGDGSHEDTLSADAATSALRDIAAARTRARLQARILPAWYGPTSGAVLGIYFVVAQRLLEADRILVQQWVLWPLAGLVVFALRRALRRSRGVIQPRSAESGAERRKQILTILAPTIAAAGLVGGVCWAVGGGAHATVVAVAVTLGLGYWAGFARHNAVIRRQLQELV
ncbi:hypothetical protein [Streptomyces atratus]|uniref:hypothetical protein n=1 Tax=Streptomyces atratus TaxID=1893 RepID=UPI0022521EDF|nr:hypothetical protein [Streptomyces atratus]MCX5343227.1 hypothetical protein [Streptomyces atratus]